MQYPQLSQVLHKNIAFDFFVNAYLAQIETLLCELALEIVDLTRDFDGHVRSVFDLFKRITFMISLSSSNLPALFWLGI